MAALRSWSSGTTGQNWAKMRKRLTHRHPYLPPLALLWKWGTSKGFQKCENPPNPETCSMRESDITSEVSRICWFAVEICCSTGSKISWPRLPGSSGLEEKAVSRTRANVVTPCHLQLWYQLESTPELLLSTTVYVNVLTRTSSFQIVLIDTARNQTLPCSDLTLNSIRISLLVGDSATPGPSSSSVAVENRMGFCWEVSPGKKKSSFFTAEKRFFTTIQLRIFRFPAEKVSKDFLSRLNGRNFLDPLIICPWDALLAIYYSISTYSSKFCQRCWNRCAEPAPAVCRSPWPMVFLSHWKLRSSSKKSPRQPSQATANDFAKKIHGQNKAQWPNCSSFRKHLDGKAVGFNPHLAFGSFKKSSKHLSTRSF